MTRCNKCPVCPFVKEDKIVKATSTNAVVVINKQVNCQTRNVIYCVSCKKCPAQYIGESDITVQKRFSEHRGYVVNKHHKKATGYHFNLPGHSVSDMQISVVEKVFNPNEQFRRQREKMFIEEFNTKYKGLNRQT